ncbi:prefoldin subunit 6 [Pyrrhoderma noxium]|uniref:Prefoldin subunit 6 n=1 Tax=Pyrrhoderma noxium TaxID=2282107 RepID=A0A286UQ46_9AGAM|nr:prefoldin subunit 6 [Pyrrhoderma noxium]
MSLEARLQTLTSAYQKLQLSLSTSIEAHQRLEAQQQETNTVKLEFKSLKPENVVYKLIGPVLIQQDQGEAKANVEKRLEFISNELKRADAQIKEVSEQIEKKRMEIVEIQTAHQAALQSQGANSPSVQVK